MLLTPVPLAPWPDQPAGDPTRRAPDRPNQVPQETCAASAVGR